MKYCDNCKFYYNDNSVFCGSCGSSLKTVMNNYQYGFLTHPVNNYKDLATIALIFGLCGVLIGFPFAIAGLIISLVARKRIHKNDPVRAYATVGLVCSVASLAYSVLVLLVLLVLLYVIRFHFWEIYYLVLKFISLYVQ